MASANAPLVAMNSSPPRCGDSASVFSFSTMAGPHFVLKSPSRENLNNTLRAMLAHATEKKVPRTQVIVDVDAVWLM